MNLIATMRNMTNAQKGVRALAFEGIKGEIVSLESNFTKNGCAYGIAVTGSDINEVRRIFKAKHIVYGEIIGGGYL